MQKTKWYKNKKVIILLFITFSILIIVGTSYALWQLTLTQTNNNTITTGCFNIEFQDANPIDLGKNASPITDEEGKKLTPYQFTLTNTCQSEATYYINLETLSNGTKLLNEKYLKASLLEGEKEIFLNTLRDTYINTEKVIAEASKAFKIATGRLKGKESKTYSLRLWLDSNTPAIQETMNAIYEGKITISLSYVPKADENRMMAKRISTYTTSDDDIYSPLSDSTKIVFLSENSPVGEIEPIDISINKTGGVLAYVDRSNQDNIVTYIKADGLILFPENSGWLFKDFTNLTEIEGLENVNTYYVTNMESIFSGCSSLANLDLSTFDTSNLQIMYRMFYGMSNLENLNLTNFDTSNVTNMEEVFQDCITLTNLDLSHFNTSKVENMQGLFRNNNFTSLNLNNWDVSNIVNGSPLFENLSNLTKLDISNWIISSKTRILDFFPPETCPSITYINASGWYFKELNEDITDLGFHLGSSLETLDISDWTFNYDDSAFIKIPAAMEENLIAKNWIFPEGTDLSELFSGRVSKTIDLSGWDTSKVVNMRAMFLACFELTDLNISSFDTGKVTNMEMMFSDCSSLTSLNISNFDTKNVTTMHSMFSGCSSLTTLDLNHFNTSRVAEMAYMFINCTSLTSLNISSFDTSKVVEMTNMFSNCTSLTSLNISSFDTSKVESVASMFENASQLTTITYSNKFIYYNNMYTYGMFYNCPANKPSHSSWNNVFQEEGA